MTRTIMHVDMNAFFASVEQQSNPRLREKPVAVIGSHKRTVITTASYGARALGVTTGMNLREAKKLCPQLIMVHANNDKYIHACAALADIFLTYTPLVELYSIDEGFLDLTGSLRLFPSAEHIALFIKDEIQKRLGLTCSIGIAPNKLLAKLASGLEKPDGLVILHPDEVSALLKDLPVQKLCGIGPHLAETLASMGIQSCGELGRTPGGVLSEKLGIIGELLPLLGRGIDDSPVIPPGKEPQQRSIGHSITFPSDLWDRQTMRQYLLQLSEMVGRRLRSYKLTARTVVLTLRYADFRTFTRRLTSRSFFDQGMSIYQNILMVFSTVRLKQKVRLLGVAVTNLGPCVTQPYLFPPSQKGAAITKVMDAINDRYGESTISRGTLLIPFPDRTERAMPSPLHTD